MSEVATGWKDRPDSIGWYLVAWCERWAYVHRRDGGGLEIFGFDVALWSGGRVFGPVRIPADPSPDALT